MLRICLSELWESLLVNSDLHRKEKHHYLDHLCLSFLMVPSHDDSGAAPLQLEQIASLALQQSSHTCRTVQPAVQNTVLVSPFSLLPLILANRVEN